MDKQLTPRDEVAAGHLTDRPEQSRATAEQEKDPWAIDRRSPGQRDRDRILYCSAFRRLASVTQVTASEAGHVFHNRLSHSLKVAQVGRRNAERLLALADEQALDGPAEAMVRMIDPDSVEASCLAHDLGHPPFGHIAEAVLRECGKEYIDDDGVFEGNAQSFRIVTRLAQRAGGSGLNLTRQTLNGVLKYPWGWEREDHLDIRDRKWGFYKDDQAGYDFARECSVEATQEKETKLPEPSIEALIMEWADDLTYAVHDVDDFFRAGLIPLHRLAIEGDDEVKRLRGLLEEAKSADRREWKHDIDELISTIVAVAGRHAPTGAYDHTREHRRRMRRFDSDLITRYLAAFRVEDAGGMIRVWVEDAIEQEVEALKMLVSVYVIRRPGLAVVQHGQQRIVRDLFEEYFDASGPGKAGDRRIFPPGPRRALEQESDNPAQRARTVIDLIAGLTEQTAIELHRRLFGDAKIALDATAHMA